MFSPADIRALVASLPPRSPTKDSPSLVRSRSGNALYRSQTIEHRLQALLESSNSRISRSTLASQLDVDDVDWLLDIHKDTLTYSNDGQYLLPTKELDTIVDGLQQRLKSDLIEVSQIVQASNISSDSIVAALERRSGTNSHQVLQADDNKRYIGSRDFVDAVTGSITILIKGAGSQQANINESWKSIPLSILHQLAHRPAEESGGKLLSSPQGLVYSPKDFDVVRGQEQLRQREARIKAYVDSVQADGFATREASVDDADVITDAAEAYRRINHQVDFIVLKANGVPSAIMSRQLLDATVDELKEKAASSAGKSFDADELVGSASRSESSTLVVTSDEFGPSIRKAYDTARARMLSEEESQFSHLFAEQIMAPLKLYIAGIGCASDETLKTNLEQFISDHFRRDFIPRFLTSTQSFSMLAQDRSHSRDLDKMRQSVEQARTLSDVDAAATKFARKRKVGNPSDELLAQVQQQTRQRLLKTIQRPSTRGSDVLQNLIWILLSRDVDRKALFMSSGKDTSRMIKLYRLIGGHGQSVSDLERWRAALKTGGNDSVTAVEEMQAMTKDL